MVVNLLPGVSWRFMPPDVITPYNVIASGVAAFCRVIFGGRRAQELDGEDTVFRRVGETPCQVCSWQLGCCIRYGNLPSSNSSRTCRGWQGVTA